MFGQVGTLGVNIIPVGKKGKAKVSALGSDGKCQELSWEHNRDYRQGTSVMGPSSLSEMISPEALGVSLPSISGSWASSIKLPHELIGSHRYDCESMCVCACVRNKQKLRNIVLASKYVCLL